MPQSLLVGPATETISAKIDEPSLAYLREVAKANERTVSAQIRCVLRAP